MIKLQLSLIIIMFLFTMVQSQTSKYNGVTWRKDDKKWKAQLQHKGKKYYGGLFDIEEHAAMKINLLCDKCQIKRKNPTINMEPDEIIQQPQNRTSKYPGVSWKAENKKWLARLGYKGNVYYGGLFDFEEHAAMKINLLCDEYEIERKNPKINIEPEAIIQHVQNQNQTSKYNGVTWRKDSKKWKAQLPHKGKKHYGGLFEIEEHAAMMVNLLCDKYEIKRKNTMINIKMDQIQRWKSKIQNQTSKYNGVYWKKDHKKWQAHLIHKGKMCFGGLFDNEEHAAMGVNLLCLKFGIKRKNLRINMNNDANRQKTKSKMSQSKTKNIVNEKGKVEDKNISTASCNAKRKRKTKCNYE